jgi:hypothetical protein
VYQHDVISQRLQLLYQKPPYSTIWAAASGTIILEEIWTNQDLHVGVNGWLLLFNHCVLKMPNESVIESMGSTLDEHAGGKRGTGFERFSMEAVTHWDGPGACQSDRIIRAALTKMFKGGPKKWRFNHIDKRHRSKDTYKSKVIAKHLKKRVRLPFLL